jgi:hypothetical protein
MEQAVRNVHTYDFADENTLENSHVSLIEFQSVECMSDTFLEM